MQCMNLRERFGKRYRVTYEESYYAERGEGGRAEDPWLMILLCQHGEICPWGGDNLAACTAKSGSVATRLKALPFATVAQDGDDGANVVFPTEHFDEVAAIMRPRKRRRGRALSPKERARLVRAGADFRFGTGRQRGNAACRGDPVPSRV